MVSKGGIELGAVDIALKDATAAAVTVDKQQWVAGALDRTQSVISDWANPDKAFIPLRMVPHLERLGRGKPGWPHITRTLAHLQGFELFRLPEVDGGAGDWLTQVGALSTEVSEIIAKICSALADDQRVDARDIKEHALIGDAEELVTRAVQLLAQLRAVAGA